MDLHSDLHLFQVKKYLDVSGGQVSGLLCPALCGHRWPRSSYTSRAPHKLTSRAKHGFLQTLSTSLQEICLLICSTKELGGNLKATTSFCLGAGGTKKGKSGGWEVRHQSLTDVALLKRKLSWKPATVYSIMI